MENGKRYKLAVNDDGALVCTDAKTGREVGLGRCTRIALDGDKGVRVAFNKRLCDLDDTAQRKLVDRVKRGEETVWAYEEPPPRRRRNKAKAPRAGA